VEEFGDTLVNNQEKNTQMDKELNFCYHKVWNFYDKKGEGAKRQRMMVFPSRFLNRCSGSRKRK
jgi:hypothetical protein